MLIQLIAAGAIIQDQAEVDPGTGTVSVPADAIANITPESSGVVAAGLPIGAFPWKRPFDPSQRSPYAFNWAPFLDQDETIADIRRITVKSSGAEVGVMVDTDAARVPTIDAPNKLVGLWFIVSDADQDNAAFDGAGQAVGVSMLIRTTADPYREYEATAVLTVRNR